MEVKEIIKKKKELSSKITELVNRFCNETEVSVENIRVTRVDIAHIATLSTTKTNGNARMDASTTMSETI